MGRYTGPKARLCRREGINLFGRPKYAKILERKPAKPGVNTGRARKMSGFGIQLREKQKLKMMYGVSEKQFRKYFDKGNSMKGLTADNLNKQLEQRLDNVLYKAGFALTRMQARQMAGHGHFMVNGRRTDIPSYQVRVGDKISVREKLKNSKLFSENLEENKSYKPSRWLKVENKSLSIEIIGEPKNDDFEQVIDCQKIIEFYSR